MSAASDTEERLGGLMRAALDGDGTAYRLLLGELRTHLRGYFARRLGGELAHSCDDLVQETLMALHARRLTYDRAQRFTVWVHAIARYKLIDHYRRRKVRRTVPLEDDAALFAVAPEGDPTARLDVERLLGTIPARPAALIREVKLEGASVAEAAARAGMTTGAAKVSIHRGLKALAARFAGGSGER